MAGHPDERQDLPGGAGTKRIQRQPDRSGKNECGHQRQDQSDLDEAPCGWHLLSMLRARYPPEGEPDGVGSRRKVVDEPRPSSGSLSAWALSPTRCRFATTTTCSLPSMSVRIVPRPGTQDERTSREPWGSVQARASLPGTRSPTFR